MPTNATRVLAVDLAVGTTQPAIPLSPRAVSALVEGQTDALTDSSSPLHGPRSHPHRQAYRRPDGSH
jgi:hypothetical protein